MKQVFGCCVGTPLVDGCPIALILAAGEASGAKTQRVGPCVEPGKPFRTLVWRRGVLRQGRSEHNSGGAN